MGRVAAHKAPFPYFGGKASIAHEVWSRLGDVGRYVEPFAGSLAVLLARPLPFTGREIVNDLDGLLVNVWRAMAADPEAVAAHADWPPTENDLHARHAWLVGHREDITRRLEGDPDWFDAKAAGWWLWGIGLCGSAERLVVAFAPLAARLRDVMVMCGDWKRVVTPAVLTSGGNGVTGVFLDPPYADTATRTADLYAKDSESVAHEVREWATANGDNPAYRIVLAGYEGEHAMPDSWSEIAWKAAGGYEGQRKDGSQGNSRRERLWFSPSCLGAGLWDMAVAV